MTAPTILLNDDNSIPQIGLGTWPLDDQAVAPVIVAVIEAGYRHIDTAARYGNERDQSAYPTSNRRQLIACWPKPAVNQIQLNPRITRPEQRAYDSAQKIVTVAWGPLGPGTDLLDDPTLAALAAKYGKTPGQIVLRWHIELGPVAIPKSANRVRMAQNIDIFDFALTTDEVAALSALDRVRQPSRYLAATRRPASTAPAIAVSPFRRMAQSISWSTTPETIRRSLATRSSIPIATLVRNISTGIRMARPTLASQWPMAKLNTSCRKFPSDLSS